MCATWRSGNETNSIIAPGLHRYIYTISTVTHYPYSSWASQLKLWRSLLIIAQKPQTPLVTSEGSVITQVDALLLSTYCHQSTLPVLQNTVSDNHMLSSLECIFLLIEKGYISFKWSFKGYEVCSILEYNLERAKILVSTCLLAFWIFYRTWGVFATCSSN